MTVDDNVMPYLQGPAVDSGDTLADGLADNDALAYALAEKSITYATSCVPQPSDQGEVERLVAKVRQQDYG